MVGDDQYIRGLFCFGDGRVDISDLRLGETPLDDFDEVELELREGVEGDLPVSLYPRQVIEDAIGVELVRPLPRDSAGDVVEEDPSIETPVVRWTAADAAQASVILSFRGGLFEVSNSGDVLPRSVSIRIRQRPESGGAWSEVETLEITGKSRTAFLRQFTWTFPTRGRWQIEIVRLTDESTSTQVSDRSTLVGLQSIRPEYPIAMGKPLALVALRIKASNQLSGSLDSFNAIAHRYAPDWDGSTWVDALTRNPASAYAAALTGPANPFPVETAGLDWDLLADWHEWCTAKGLTYDRVHERAETLGETLRAIAAAGRAAPRHDGLTWGVVIDRPQDLAVDHVSPRNASGFRVSRPYFDPPDAFRAAFFDESNDWAPAVRLVPWPGHSGPIDVVETVEVPGLTNAAGVAIALRRRQLELIHRPDQFTYGQSGTARVATRGDLVHATADVLDIRQIAARVTSVLGRLVELDEAVEFEAGESYALRWRIGMTEADPIGESVVAAASAASGQTGLTDLIRLADGDPMPAEGALVQFGVLGSESYALRIRTVEPGEDFSSVFTAVADAPEIDEALDAYEPPAWNGRVGEEVDAVVIAPAAPRFVEILTGRKGTGDKDGLRVLLAPGLGSAAVLGAFRIDHRPTGGGAWTEVEIPAAAGGVAISGYARGDEVDLRAVAIASDGTEGPASATVAVEIGGKDDPIPAALDDDAIDVDGGLGAISIRLAATDDAATERVQVYRAATGVTLDPGSHAVGRFGVSPRSTVTYIDGDGTRETLVEGGKFGSGADWTLDANWSIASGVATHAPGAADTISQAVDLAEGKTYRIAFVVSGRTAGSVTPQLTGGTTQAGTAISTDGQVFDSIVAGAGAAALSFAASSDFDGSIDEVVIFRETGRCIAAGVWDVWLEPQDANGIPGPVSGPFSITVS